MLLVKKLGSLSHFSEPLLTFRLGLPPEVSPCTLPLIELRCLGDTGDESNLPPVTFERHVDYVMSGGIRKDTTGYDNK